MSEDIQELKQDLRELKEILQMMLRIQLEERLYGRNVPHMQESKTSTDRS